MKDHSENRTENRTNNCKNQSQNRSTNQTTNEHKQTVILSVTFNSGSVSGNTA